MFLKGNNPLLHCCWSICCNVISLSSTIHRADTVCRNHNSSGFVVILDMQNATWDSVPSVSLVTEIVGILKWIYPGRLNRLFVLNSGWIFSFAWNMVKPLLSQNTLGKIKFVNTQDVSAVLTSNIGVGYLETEYGGTNDDIMKTVL
jgi:hypothetical protein